MNRFLAFLSMLFSCSLAFAEEGEVAVETVGTGGVIAFLVVCVLMAVAFFWYMRPAAKKEEGDKIGEDK